jgi:hypothetical protein
MQVEQLKIGELYQVHQINTLLKMKDNGFKFIEPHVEIPKNQLFVFVCFFKTETGAKCAQLLYKNEYYFTFPGNLKPFAK